jgi:hypothetical protein
MLLPLVVAAAVAQSPIMCNLNALSAAEREQHAAATVRLKAAMVRAEELKDGFRFFLRADMPITDLFRWIEREQRCCPFLDFEVRIDRENGARWLQLTGREAVKEFLAAEFGAAKQ